MSENTRLKQEIKLLRDRLHDIEANGDVSWTVQRNAVLEENRRAMEALIERLQQDAKRYRWLVENANLLQLCMPAYREREACTIPCTDPDAVFDAAIAATEARDSTGRKK